MVALPDEVVLWSSHCSNPANLCVRLQAEVVHKRRVECRCSCRKHGHWKNVNRVHWNTRETQTFAHIVLMRIGPSVGWTDTAYSCLGQVVRLMSTFSAKAAESCSRKTLAGVRVVARQNHVRLRTCWPTYRELPRSTSATWPETDFY